MVRPHQWCRRSGGARGEASTGKGSRAARTPVGTDAIRRAGVRAFSAELMDARPCPVPQTRRSTETADPTSGLAAREGMAHRLA